LHLCGTAIEWTAWATIALAAVGAISIIVNGYLAWSTHRSAKSAKDQVDLERKQLELFQRQLELAERQVAAGANPKLYVTKVSLGDSDLSSGGDVMHVQGAEPALEVEVWIRGRARLGAAWGLWYSRVGFLAPGTTKGFAATLASATQQDACPFPSLLTKDGPAAGRLLIGWTWKRVDGAVDRQTAEPIAERLRAPGFQDVTKD
jgi:hypothetical protein